MPETKRTLSSAPFGQLAEDLLGARKAMLAADHGCSQRYFCPRKSEKWRTLKFLDFNIL
jgi:hypothetical protein